MSLRGLVRRVPGAVALARHLGLITDRRIFLLSMLPANSIGAEIGVDKGDFSHCLLQHFRPRELHLIDPWRYEGSERYREALYGGKASGGQKELDDRYRRVCSRFESAIAAGVVRIHRANSDHVLTGFPDSYFDWIYIDGNHFYEFVKKDLELSLAKVRPGGFITGDDYVDGKWWEGGVKRAVDEFTAQKPVRIVEIRTEQFVLQRD